MSEPFLAEVRIMAFNFPPRGWAFCDGQILPINQNQSLYSLLGTTYGGDGRTSFALPDLRGRTPIHVGRSNGGQFHTEGQKSGEETHALAANEMPQHTHNVEASSTDGNSINTTGAVLAREVGGPYSASASNLANLRSGTIANVGGGQSHENMQPYIAVNFCIALQGLFPSRN
ncbi:MAG: phage tail protein [Roseitalea sp.]|nr:phage tail protein [Roseitalea sp.]MBO6952193.1 phage tail protein [Rhizobiaceae bacterium]MBO6591961.1 phage tail protein [Roseitalea sp.]MBO6598216.1 phage tail protein [Roseitalea sp.]MBO6610662.1 phage tail protein [Roseitalea sp.]